MHDFFVIWLCAHGNMCESCNRMTSCKFGPPTITLTIEGNAAVIIATLVGACKDAIVDCFFFLACFLKLC